MDCKVEELEQTTNPFGIVVLAVLYVLESKKDLDKKYQFKLQIMRLLLQKGFDKDKIRNWNK